MNEVSKFSSKVITLLEKAGWSPDRRVSIDDFEKMLDSTYSVFPCIQDFLSRFSGLTLRRSTRFGELVVRFEIDDRIFDEWETVLRVEDQLGFTVCPIGGNTTADFMLLMDEIGRVHLARLDSWNVFLLGLDGNEAIENFFTHSPTEASGRLLESSCEPDSRKAMAKPLEELEGRLLAEFPSADFRLDAHSIYATLSVYLRGTAGYYSGGGSRQTYQSGHLRKDCWGRYFVSHDTDASNQNYKYRDWDKEFATMHEAEQYLVAGMKANRTDYGTSGQQDVQGP